MSKRWICVSCGWRNDTIRCGECGRRKGQPPEKRQRDFVVNNTEPLLDWGAPGVSHMSPLEKWRLSRSIHLALMGLKRELRIRLRCRLRRPAATVDDIKRECVAVIDEWVEAGLLDDDITIMTKRSEIDRAVDVAVIYPGTGDKSVGK